MWTGNTGSDDVAESGESASPPMAATRSCWKHELRFRKKERVEAGHAGRDSPPGFQRRLQSIVEDAKRSGDCGAGAGERMVS